MKIKVGDLRKALENVSDDMDIFVQVNTKGEDDDDDSEDYTYTFATGFLFDGFVRSKNYVNDEDKEFVLDVAVTDSEGDIF